MRAEPVCTCRLNGCPGARGGRCTCPCSVHGIQAPRGVTYHGVRTGGSCFVWCDDGHGDCGELAPRHDVRNHSPDGFEWGYGGSGPAQLALALTLDVLEGDVERARRIYQEVKWRIVARLPPDSWALSRDYLADRIAIIEASLTAGSHEQAADVGRSHPDATGQP